jgi:hypothetical protein
MKLFQGRNSTIFLLAGLIFLTGCNQSADSLGESSAVIVEPSNPTEPVPPANSSSATLVWSAPLEKENGAPLPADELSGYQIYYGPINNPYENVVTIDSPYLTSYTINNLPSGEYSFCIVAVDTAGKTSSFSNAIIKSIG